MRVDVSGHKFVFPQQCACCGGSPETALTAVASRTTGTRVEHTTSKSWDFPYCGRCIHHVKAAESATGSRRVLTGIALIVAVVLWVASGSFFLGLLVAACGVAGGVFFHKNLMQRARGMCCADCVCVERAVGYVGWQGACHMFEIASPPYALAFMAANVKKLVNVQPEVWQWLQANGYAPQMHQPQSARRYTR